MLCLLLPTSTPLSPPLHLDVRGGSDVPGMFHGILCQVNHSVIVWGHVSNLTQRVSMGWKSFVSIYIEYIYKKYTLLEPPLP